MSSTAIGHALYNLYNFMGYKSVGINHLGDWGTQFGKLLAAYELWGGGMDVETGGVDAMLEALCAFSRGGGKGSRRWRTWRGSWFKRIEDGDVSWRLSLVHPFQGSYHYAK